MKTKLAILQKGNNFAVIGRVVGSDDEGKGGIPGVVTFFDAREKEPARGLKFDTGEETDEGFKRAIAKSESRDWEVRYIGGQLNNPVFS
jgi:hypothetical protein